MRNTFVDEIINLAATDDRIVFLTGDLGFSVVERFVEKYPDRFINVGIAEQNMIGIAAGLALSGKMVFTYSIANFATLRCLEQTRNDICYHNANVKVISVGCGFAYGSQGYTHYGLEDIAIMRSLPNIRVLSPSDPIETRLATQHIAKIDGPCYLRLGKGNEKTLHDDSLLATFKNESFPQFPLLPLINLNRKSVILSTGPIAEQVYALILRENLNCDLWSVPSIKPFDLVGLKQVLSYVEKIITIEEHQLDAGFGSSVMEASQLLQEKKIIQQLPRFHRLGVENLIPEIIGSQNLLRSSTLKIEKIKSLI